MSGKWRIFPFLPLVWTTQIHHLWTRTTFPEPCLHFKAIVRHKLQYLFWFFLPLPVQLHRIQGCGVCLQCWDVFVHIKSSNSLKSFIESSTWLRVFLKKMCLFCLLDLLFLVSEYCASRKKSLNCWSRAFFQSLPRIKWLNKEAHRFHFLTRKKKI